MTNDIATIDDADVQAHLNDLKAAYAQHLLNGAQESILGIHHTARSSVLLPASGKTITITIPLTPELVDAVRAAEGL